MNTHRSLRTRLWRITWAEILLLRRGAGHEITPDRDPGHRSSWNQPSQMLETIKTHRSDMMRLWRITWAVMRGKFDQQGMLMEEKMGKKFFCCDAVLDTKSRQIAIFSGWAKELQPVSWEVAHKRTCS